MEAHSKAGIYGALAANGAIAVMKFIVASITGSSAMLSEGIHSTVDSGNQLLLLWGMRKSKKPADEMHPFGHGQELYFYTLIVSVLIFALGGGMSVYEGIMHINHPVETTDPTWNYIVLGAAFIFEGFSMVIPLRQFFKINGTRHFWTKLRASKDPTFFVVVFENGAALIGLLIAFAGVFFSRYYQLPIIDGIASILIGIVLALVAFILVVESRNLLIGESADKATVQAIYELVNDDPDVLRLHRPLTMHMGPGEVLLALDVEFETETKNKLIPEVVARLEQNIKNKFPFVKQIFIEARNLAEKSKQHEHHI